MGYTFHDTFKTNYIPEVKTINVLSHRPDFFRADVTLPIASSIAVVMAENIKFHWFHWFHKYLFVSAYVYCNPRLHSFVIL